MGFDMFIKPLAGISPTTGRVVPLDKRTYLPNDDLMMVAIEECQRPFMTLRGGYLHAYIQEFDDSETQVAVDVFKHRLPSWETVRSFLGIETPEDVETWQWKETDHWKLFEVLTQLSNLPIAFEIQWSY